MVAAVCMVAMVMGMSVLASCSKDDDEKESNVQRLFRSLEGDWETDVEEGFYPQDIVQYRAEVVCTDASNTYIPLAVGNVHLYAIYAIQKDGQQYAVEAGYIVHKSGGADDEVVFHDDKHSRERQVKITWLDNTRSSVVLYADKVFKKK